MKHDMNEVLALETAIKESAVETVELNDLQLALVGGGTGEVVMV